MTTVDIQVLVKVGPVTLEFASSEGDVLHHIDASTFANKVLELANYIGPPDAAPSPPPSPRVTTVMEDPRKLVGYDEPQLFDTSSMDEQGPAQGERVGHVGSVAASPDDGPKLVKFDIDRDQ